MPTYKDMEKETVLKAIKGSRGIISTIAKKLHCHSETARNLCNKWDETQEALKDEVNFILDAAECVVQDDIILNKNVATAKWLLEIKGKERGYDISQTLKVDNGEPLNIKFEAFTKEKLQNAGNIEIGGLNEEEGSQ